ncbi:protein-L-isoaspartate(D-aspartate) O-methyltransferase [Bacteroidales bacterium OttesenSCG-928-C19]|nr:protein-L-isoaspartate(D-aspartate) O-methyltransferase [Bacteroidales bacterium OttesenSCG-928-C19]
MIDTFKHKGLRKKLIEELQSKGINDIRVLTAIEKIPRHFFLDSALEAMAYQDRALPIACGQTISQPFTVAFQSQLLNIVSGEKILEVGTGSGYQTSVLCEMGAKVYSIERHRPLYLKSKTFLEKLGYFPKCFYGDGYAGLPAYAPFDKIIITCGAPAIPEDLFKQLKVGGIMVIPVGDDIQEMLLIKKIDENNYESSSQGSFKFVPMLEKKES